MQGNALTRACAHTQTHTHITKNLKKDFWGVKGGFGGSAVQSSLLLKKF